MPVGYALNGGNCFRVKNKKERLVGGVDENSLIMV
jgi:hypothetical protein